MTQEKAAAPNAIWHPYKQKLKHDQLTEGCSKLAKRIGAMCVMGIGFFEGDQMTLQIVTGGGLPGTLSPVQALEMVLAAERRAESDGRGGSGEGGQVAGSA